MFRLLFVWPALIHAWERAWRDREEVVGTVVTSPDRLGALSEDLGLRPGYVDRFTLTTDVDACAGEWTTASFANVDRRSRDMIFETLLRMRTAPDGTPGTVLGRRIVTDDPDWFLLQADGPLVSTNLALKVTDGEVALITSLEYHAPLGRLIWAFVSRVHRRLAPGLLRGGSTFLRRRLHDRTSAERR